MFWALAGMAALSTATSLYSSNAAASASAKAAGKASLAEGQAIVRERLNTTLRNSYSTALAQMNLALQKRQLSTQATDIRAATLAAQGNADVAAASTDTFGASVKAVASDIQQKSQAALDMTDLQFENAIENYNNELQMMVLNTDQSAPTVRSVSYDGPSGGQMVGMALMQGLGTFASAYAARSMSLGLGPKAATPSLGSGLSLDSPSGIGLKLRSGYGVGM